MTAVRLLPYAVADGPTNMAADEALLTTAAAGPASLRFYGWSTPTVSLGYFQPHAVRFSDPLLSGLPWVRRPTGGATLVHHHELTYALALPAGRQWQKPGESWLSRMHVVIADALAGLGATVENVDRESKGGDVLCFQHHTPGDLRVGAAKVVGSAQRRQRGALLQHGSVLLAASPFTPALPGVAELTNRTFLPEELTKAVLDALAHATGWTLTPGAWTEEERLLTAELAERKYSLAAWNEKR